jgi:D-tyrosyl-tRNA(Tyr) deacylase
MELRAVVQRVSQASVEVEGRIVGQTASGPGLLVLLGAAKNDGPSDVDTLVEKICGLRIFEDEQGKMNLSVSDVQGSLLVVSQFTLYGDCRKGRRPSFMDALEPERARVLIDRFVERASAHVPVQTGQFQTHMRVSLVNDGPVTLLLDSHKAF